MDEVKSENGRLPGSPRSVSRTEKLPDFLSSVSCRKTQLLLGPGPSPG